MADADADVLHQVTEGVARIVLNRPERRNALSFEGMGRLAAQLDRARRDPASRVVVLEGAGDQAFCAGMDLNSVTDDVTGIIALHESRVALAEVFEKLWTLGKPTIAKIQGFALAGGFGLACACDIVVASERARFGAPEINVGLWPHLITVPLMRAMPPRAALELMMTGRLVGAEEGLRLGFVSRIAAPDQLERTVSEVAGGLAEKSLAALRLGRDSFYATWDMNAADAFIHLRAMLSIHSETRDAKEGISAFLEKRPPKWVDA